MKIWCITAAYLRRVPYDNYDPWHVDIDPVIKLKLLNKYMLAGCIGGNKLFCITSLGPC